MYSSITYRKLIADFYIYFSMIFLWALVVFVFCGLFIYVCAVSIERPLERWEDQSTARDKRKGKFKEMNFFFLAQGARPGICSVAPCFGLEVQRLQEQTDTHEESKVRRQKCVAMDASCP